MGETTEALRKTALNAVHRSHKAKMVDFGGWDMPVEYSGLVAEHMAVRTGVGLFDVSHMGDIQFRGPGSLAAIQRLCMNDASKLSVGQAQYSAMLHENGEVTVENVASYRLAADVSVNVPCYGTVYGDIAWGGNWFFLVREHKMDLSLKNVEELTNFTWAIRLASTSAS